MDFKSNQELFTENSTSFPCTYIVVSPFHWFSTLDAPRNHWGRLKKGVGVEEQRKRRKGPIPRPDSRSFKSEYLQVHLSTEVCMFFKQFSWDSNTKLVTFAT